MCRKFQSRVTPDRSDVTRRERLNFELGSHPFGFEPASVDRSFDGIRIALFSPLSYDLDAGEVLIRASNLVVKT